MRSCCICTLERIFVLYTGMQCSPLKNLRNGRITGNDRTFNSTMTFQCNPKYTLFGPSIRRCRAKGLWDGKKSRCSKSIFVGKSGGQDVPKKPETFPNNYVCSKVRSYLSFIVVG